MPTSSARPERLEQYGEETDRWCTQAAPIIDEAARAYTRFVATSADPGSTFLAVTSARSAREQVGTLAATTRQVARAFRAADAASGGVAGPRGHVTADDLWLSLTLAAYAPGLLTPDLIAPRTFAAGREAATAILAAEPSDREQLLAQLEATDGYGATFAAGLVTGLGAEGLSEVVEDLRRDYESSEVGLTDADAALAVLTRVLGTAATTLRSDGVRPGGSTGTGSPAGAYAMDIGLVDELGQTATGRNVLRQLIIDIGWLPTPMVVDLGRHLAMGNRAVDDARSGRSMNLLFDRTLLRDPNHVADPDLAVIRLLGRDPQAAWLWELHAGTDRSPTVINLSGGRHSPQMVDALAPVVHAVLVQSVEHGRASAYAVEQLVDPVQPGPPLTAPVSLSQRSTLPEIVQIAGDTAPSMAMSGVLADVFATHPELFRERAAITAYDGYPDPVLIDYFAILARNRGALAAAIATNTRLYRDEAARVIARTSPDDATGTEVLGGLTDAHGVTIALEIGATRAGQHHDVARGMAVGAIALGLTTVATAAGRHPATGPAGGLAAKAASASIKVAEREATERWVDTNDGRGDEVTIASQRAEPYLLALALAQDANWGPLMVDPGAIAGLDVVGSATDRRAFAAWLGRQPEPLATLITDRMAKS